MNQLTFPPTVHNGFLFATLPQMLFKLLPLCWDLGEGDILGRPLESKVCVFHSFLALLNISLTGFQSLTFWGLLLLVQNPWPGKPGVRLGPGSSRRPSVGVMSLPHHPPAVSPGLEVWAWLDWVSTPLTCLLVTSLYLQLQKIISDGPEAILRQ